MAHQVTLVATLPRDMGPLARSTRSVLLEMLREAAKEILVVGFEVREKDLLAELGKAAARGVRVYIICDQGRQSWKHVRSAWPGSSEPATIYYNSAPDGPEGPTLMHGKSILVDSKRLFISSANLTSGGLDRNIELGALIEGPAVQKAREIYARLMRSRHLSKL